MKLGEALRLRSDNTKKILELRTRAIASAQTQEGAAAPDAPAALLDVIELLSAETLMLVQRINRTNVATQLPSGQPLVDALAERDYLLAVRNPFEAVDFSGLPALDSHHRFFCQQRLHEGDAGRQERSIHNLTLAGPRPMVQRHHDSERGVQRGAVIFK